MKIQELQIKEQAKKAMDYHNNGGGKRGGMTLTHKINGFGVALKFIFALKDLTFEQVGVKLNSSAQSVNYIVNRMKKNKFNDVYIDKLCHILSIDSAYFKDLVNEIDNIMEG